MKQPMNYIVEGAASHFLDECLGVGKCIRCGTHVGSGDPWTTIAQVMRRVGRDPSLCGGVLCVACHRSFVQWLDSAPLNGDDSG